MQLPKHHETFVPILTVLSDGKTIHVSEMRKRVHEEFFPNLSQEALDKKTKDGGSLLMSRISWGKAYLKQAKMLEQPERGMVRISKKGQESLRKKKLSWGDILKDKDFLAHEKLLKDKKENEVVSVDSSSTPEDIMNSGFESIEKQLKSDLLERLKETDPFYFERVILILFKKMGYGDFLETSKTGDGGIDGIINQDQLGVEKIYTQAKRYTKGSVGSRDMTNFIGAIARDSVNKGIFVTTSVFSQSAIDTAERCRDHIVLIDGVRLVNLMIKYNVGVQGKVLYEVKEIDEDFFEDN